MIRGDAHCRQRFSSSASHEGMTRSTYTLTIKAYPENHVESTARTTHLPNHVVVPTIGSRPNAKTVTGQSPTVCTSTVAPITAIAKRRRRAPALPQAHLARQRPPSTISSCPTTNAHAHKNVVPSRRPTARGRIDQALNRMHCRRQTDSAPTPRADHGPERYLVSGGGP